MNGDDASSEAPVVVNVALSDPRAPHLPQASRASPGGGASRGTSGNHESAGSSGYTEQGRRRRRRDENSTDGRRAHAARELPRAPPHVPPLRLLRRAVPRARVAAAARAARAARGSRYPRAGARSCRGRLGVPSSGAGGGARSSPSRASRP